MRSGCFSTETVDSPPFTLPHVHERLIYVELRLQNSTLPAPFLNITSVRAFLWANPERVAEIGLIIYRGCDSAVYAALADEMPEIRPRGDPMGYRRKF